MIPGYTLLFSGGRQWFGTNFSVVAALSADNYWGFILWGAIVGIYFLALMLPLGRGLKSRAGRLGVYSLSAMACLCLTGALVLPYVPEYLPRCASAHVLLAFTACVLMMAAMLLVLLCRRERKLLGWWIAIALVSGGLFAAAGIITSALEIWFVISSALLLRRLWLKN